MQHETHMIICNCALGSISPHLAPFHSLQVLHVCQMVSLPPSLYHSPRPPSPLLSLSLSLSLSLIRVVVYPL